MDSLGSGEEASTFHTQLHKSRLNRKITVILGVDLQDSPLIGYK